MIGTFNRRRPGWLWPRRIRARLTLLYALLFLTAGAGLLALNYGLLANRLPPDTTSAKLGSNADRKLQELCRHPGTQIGSATLLQCKQAFAAGSRAASQGQRERTLGSLLDSSLIGLGVVTLLSAWLGWILSGRALRPIKRITETARRASALDLSERIALSGPDDELKELADTFDHMLARLDAAFESQHRFVANAAHELRTPLTVMRTSIDVTLSKPSRTPEQLESMAGKIHRSVERAQDTVEALLTLATTRQAASDEPIDLATAAEDALDALAPAIAERGLAVDLELASAPTAGDAVLLERMIANLIENAVKHNQPAGFIRVRTADHDGAALFEVSNSGPVVPESAIAQLIEPFSRAQQRLNPEDGVGLGLSIANAIAIAHGTSPRIHSLPDGGLQISISLRPQERNGAP